MLAEGDAGAKKSVPALDHPRGVLDALASDDPTTLRYLAEQASAGGAHDFACLVAARLVSRGEASIPWLLDLGTRCLAAGEGALVSSFLAQAEQAGATPGQVARLHEDHTALQQLELVAPPDWVLAELCAWLVEGDDAATRERLRARADREPLPRAQWKSLGLLSRFRPVVPALRPGLQIFPPGTTVPFPGLAVVLIVGFGVLWGILDPASRPTPEDPEPLASPAPTLAPATERPGPTPLTPALRERLVEAGTLLSGCVRSPHTRERVLLLAHAPQVGCHALTADYEALYAALSAEQPECLRPTVLLAEAIQICARAPEGP